MTKKTKNNLKIFVLLTVLFVSILFFSQKNICLAVEVTAENAGVQSPYKPAGQRTTTALGSYTPMEEIPEQGRPTDFYDYINAVYKFGIGAVGVCALLMIIVGGYMYATSAGNNASMEKAKGVITDAIVGLVLALASYLILYFINPDLVKIKRLQPVSSTATETGAKTTTPGSTLGDKAAREKLAAAGISINKSNCATESDTNCTSLDYMPEYAIDSLIALSKDCAAFAGKSCNIKVTGGTEAGHSSHKHNEPMIDTASNETLANFLKKQRSEQKYSTYRIGQICTVKAEYLNSISFNHSYGKTCQDPSSTEHFHFSFNG